MSRYGSLLIIAMALLTVPFLHHGHILMFIADVHRALPAWTKRRARTEASRLSIPSAAPGMRYELAVRRKSRAVETSLHVEGERVAIDRWLQMISDQSAAIGAALGPGVEPERLTRTSARVRHVHVLSAFDDWSPKRDLTPDVVAAASRRLERFIDVLEPIVTGGR